MAQPNDQDRQRARAPVVLCSDAASRRAVAIPPAQVAA